MGKYGVVIGVNYTKNPEAARTLTRPGRTMYLAAQPSPHPAI